MKVIPRVRLLTTELMPEDARIYMQLSRRSPPNNIQLDDIARSTNNNNLISHSDRVRTHLNDTARNMQTVQLEEKVIALNQGFEKTSDAVRARILQEVQCVINILDQEQRNVNTIRDPPSMRGRRTYGRGGKRLPTGAEIADKELRDQQKLVEKEARSKQILIRPIQSGNTQTNRPANPPMTDFINIPPVTPNQPFVMTFDASGAIVRSSQGVKRQNAYQGQLMEPRTKRARME
jgi:hypothetical protein